MELTKIKKENEQFMKALIELHIEQTDKDMSLE